MRTGDGSTAILRKVLIALVASVAASSAAADEVETTYMAIYYGPAKVGYAQADRTVQAKTVRYEMTVAICSRDGLSGWRIETNETLDGKPLSSKRRNLDGSAPVDMVFNKGKMHITRGASGSTEVKPVPKGALLGEGELLLMRSKGLRDGTDYSFTTIDPISAEPTTVTIHVGPVKDVRVLGNVEQLREVTREDGDIRCVNYLDEDCNLRKGNFTVMGLELEMVACDEELALSANSPLDLHVSTAIKLPSDISEYRDATAMEIVLLPDGKTSFYVPSTDAQSVSRRPDGSFVVTVRVLEAPSGCSFPYRGNDPELLAALGSSIIYECQDPQILEAARGAVGSCVDADVACRKLELFVRAHIAYKVHSPDEAATSIYQHQQGTCRQHAILMVTLCRAVGIPARMVMGLASGGGNQLSGHAWVQCNIGGRWVDYDAALQGFDVAHVALWTGSGDVDYQGLMDKFGHLTAVQVTLELPWYRRLGWPAAGVGVLCAWLLWRRRRKARLSRAMGDPSQPGPA